MHEDEQMIEVNFGLKVTQTKSATMGLNNLHTLFNNSSKALSLLLKRSISDHTNSAKTGATSNSSLKPAGRQT
jgi:hypothetical protein